MEKSKRGRWVEIRRQWAVTVVGGYSRQSPVYASPQSVVDSKL
jgi:hypothetical protein